MDEKAENDSLINSYNTYLSEEITLINKAKEFAGFAYADNTMLAYRKDWKAFEAWCKSKNIDPLPCHINIVSLYITELADLGKKVATISRAICAISKRHIMANHLLNLKDNNFISIWNGIKRKLGTAKKGKSPLLLNMLRNVISEIDKQQTNIAIRDKALISFGWASAMRRSEIVALNWNDIEFIDEGIKVSIKKSKTDQYGEGQKIAILYGRYVQTCPIRNLLKLKEISEGNIAIFTSINRGHFITSNRLQCKDVARIIKKHLLNLGIDPTNFAGHSLRAGFITTAAKHSVPDHIIMKHSRHKSVQMLQVYTRDNSLIHDNATSMVGL